MGTPHFWAAGRGVNDVAGLAPPAPERAAARRYDGPVTLRLYDTATRGIRDFVPLEAGKVGIYLCGLTVQSEPHVGHVRSAVNFDVTAGNTPVQVALIVSLPCLPACSIFVYQ